MKNYFKHKKKGSALPIVIFSTMIVVTFLAIYINYINNEFQSQRLLVERTTAVYLAEAGIEEAFYLYSITSEDDLIDLSPFNGSISYNKDLGTYEVKYLGNGVFKSKGVSVEKRVYTIEVALDSSGKVIRWEEKK